MMLEENLAKKRKRAVDDQKSRVILGELDINVEPSKLVTQKYFELRDNCRVCYINAAFRSTSHWEVFMFIHFDYVVISYDPASLRNNRIVKGPIVLCDGFPSLYGTCFQKFGVTAAFGCGGYEAFIFSRSSCALIHIAPETQTGGIIEGPKHINKMFPCLIGINFLEKHVDAALESPVADEAYLFQGSEYALINYSKRTLIRTGLITDAFPCLVKTMFASGIGAAFASHTLNQAYLFKDNFYVLIHFTPGEPNDSYIISGPDEIVPANWPCLRGLIPFKTTGNDTMEPKTWKPLRHRNGYVRIPIVPNELGDNDKHSKLVMQLHPEQCKPPLDYGYVQAAFRSTCKNEAFMFLDYEYVVINYDPASPRMDFVVRGPHLLCDGFPSLYATSLHEFGVTAAFGCHGANEAFLFSGVECAKIIYAPDTRTGAMIKGPRTYEDMFPCLIGMIEQDPIDAAFESTVTGEAFLFQGSKYFLINYSKRTLISTGLITDAFPCLRNTMFESDIESSFASHTCNQAYLFKGNSYVLIHFSPDSGGSNHSSIIAGPEEIVPTSWPSLQGLVPFKRGGADEMEPKTWMPIWYGNKAVIHAPKIQ